MNAWSYADINLDELSISATMPDEPPSQMIRVPTPLVVAVRELSRLHRAGRTKAVLKGVECLVAAIDSETDVDIDSVSETISKLTSRLEQLESERIDSQHDIDIDSLVQPISERLEKVETDIESIALMIANLNVRVSDLEGVGDIGYDVTPISELEAPTDINLDIDKTAEPSDQADQGDIAADVEPIAKAKTSAIQGRTISGNSSIEVQEKEPADITIDSNSIAEPAPLPPLLEQSLTQMALAKRLGCSDKAIEKHRKQDSKESFAAWSRERDPNGIAWGWEGTGGRGQPLRFLPY